MTKTGMSFEDRVVAVGGRLDLQDKDELIANIHVASEAAKLEPAHLDTLLACDQRGPLWDGDVPSKPYRDDLVGLGAVAKVSVKGEQGYNACTYQGHAFLRVLGYH